MKIVTGLVIALIAGHLSLTAAGVDVLLNHLESVRGAEMSVYRLRDNQGRGMDCLKVFQSEEPEPGVYYGVYHHRLGGLFSIHLARSLDLKNWVHLTPLDEHASQATMWACENGGYILAYEKDAPNSCWIRMRYYQSISDLSKGSFAREFDVSRTLAPTAEGTPSIESVRLDGRGINESEIKIRFHYYKNGDVDQLARGTLINFTSWNAEPSDELNAALIQSGWLGNLGDRDKFSWLGDTFYFQEIQRKKGDWSSWRVGLCASDGGLIRPLSLRTHQGSTTFANPTASWITEASGKRKLVVTLFLLSEGNPPAERGTLLYVVDPVASSAKLNRSLP